MRNIAKYPITVMEVEEALDDLYESTAGEGRVGDLRPVILEMVGFYLADHKEEFRRFLETRFVPRGD